MVWVPEGREAVENVVPALVIVSPLTVQSTSITAGSITLTRRIPGSFTAPGGGSVESMGTTARQMLKTICSRDTELKLVLTSLPNRLFIIELHDCRYWPVPTYRLPRHEPSTPVGPMSCTC